MTTPHPWDGYATRLDVTKGAYQRWTNPGDRLEGHVVECYMTTDANNAEACGMDVRTADGQTVKLSITQTNLINQLVPQRHALQPGAYLIVEYLGNGASRPGYSPAKMFKIDIIPASAQATPQAAPVPQAAPYQAPPQGAVIPPPALATTPQAPGDFLP